MNFFYDSFLTLRGIHDYRRFLSRSQFFTTDQIIDYQTIRLKKLLIHCQLYIPWYQKRFREFNVNVKGEDPFSELGKLPVLTKRDVLQNHSEFFNVNFVDVSLKFRTSGTTGQQLISYTSPGQWINEQGCIWRQWKWAGYSFRDRVAIFRSYSPDANGPLIKVDKLKNWCYFSVFKMDDNSLEEYFSFLLKWKPRFLRAYPSALLLLARYALKRNQTIPSLRGAFVASESLDSSLRKLVQSAFDIPIFDHYGQAETTCMFHDCEEHDGMHVDWEYGYVELLESGNSAFRSIVATNLHNLAMPLLRYDTGDLSASDWKTCSCNRTSAVIERVLGRKDDFIIGADGSRIGTVNIYTFFSRVSDLERFQVVQDQIGHLDIMISLQSRGNDEESSKVVEDQIYSYFANFTALTVFVAFGENWVQSVEGKFSPFIQRCT